MMFMELCRPEEESAIMWVDKNQLSAILDLSILIFVLYIYQLMFFQSSHLFYWLHCHDGQRNTQYTMHSSAIVP